MDHKRAKTIRIKAEAVEPHLRALKEALPALASLGDTAGLLYLIDVGARALQGDRDRVQLVDRKNDHAATEDREQTGELQRSDPSEPEPRKAEAAEDTEGGPDPLADFDPDDDF